MGLIYDEDLLRRVELRINAKNIHDVNAIKGAYYASCEGFKRYPQDKDRIDGLKWSKGVLNEFADTGDIDQAKKNWYKYMPRYDKEWRRIN